MERLDANLDAGKWSLLEKAHDYRFLLRLLDFALVADLALALTTGSNLWTLRWADVGGRPGLVLMVVLAYGVVMTLGSALLSWVAMDVLGLVVPSLQNRLGLVPNRPEPDPQRYVGWLEAETWLAAQTDAARRAPVERQMAEWHRDRHRWFSMVNAGWAGSALVVAGLWVPGSCVVLLGQWHRWAPLTVLLVPLLPCAYHVWVGMPGHGKIELPELAKALYRKKHRNAPAFAEPTA